MSNLGLGGSEDVAEVFATGRNNVLKTHGHMFATFDNIARAELHSFDNRERELTREIMPELVSMVREDFKKTRDAVAKICPDISDEEVAVQMLARTRFDLLKLRSKHNIL